MPPAERTRPPVTRQRGRRRFVEFGDFLDPCGKALLEIGRLAGDRDEGAGGLLAGQSGGRPGEVQRGFDKI